MNNKMSVSSNSPAYYRIKLQGHLDSNWSDWFEGMIISCEGANTILTGQLADQAALHGILIRIRDLNLKLLSVEGLEADQEKKNSLPPGNNDT